MKQFFLLVLWVVKSGTRAVVREGVTQEVWPILEPTTVAYGRSAVENEEVKPNQVSEIINFDAAAKNTEPFGQRVKGYFLAPQSGEYKFYSSCSSQCDIFLSVDGKGFSTNPDQKSKIISQSQGTLHNEFDKYPEQVSHAVYLEKGRAYYIEGVERQKEGLGLMSVGVVLPDDTKVFPIRGSYLIPTPDVQKEEGPKDRSPSDKVASIQQRKYGLTAKRKRDSLYQRLQKINEFIKHLQDEAKTNKTSEADLLREAEKAEESAAKGDGSGEDGTFLDVKGEHFADQDAVEPGINIYVGNGDKNSEFAKANSKPADFSKIDDRVVSNDKDKNPSLSTMLSLKNEKPEVDKAEVRMPTPPANESLGSKKSGSQLPTNVQQAPVSDAMYDALMNLLKEEIAQSASAKGQVASAKDKTNGTGNVTSSVKAANTSATMVENILNLFKSQGGQLAGKSGLSIPGANLVALLRTPGNGLVASTRNEITKSNPVAKMMAAMKPDDLAALFQLNEEINNLRTILAYKTVKSVRTEKTVHYPGYLHEEYHLHDDHPKEEPMISDVGLSANPFSPPLIAKKEKSPPLGTNDFQDAAIRKWIHSQSGAQRDLHIHKENVSQPGGPQIVKVDFSQPGKEEKGSDSEFQHQFPLSPSDLANQVPDSSSVTNESPKAEERHESGEASQIVPPAAMMGMTPPGYSGLLSDSVAEAEHSFDHEHEHEHEHEHVPDYDHVPHHDITVHHFSPNHDYHNDYHHEGGDTVVSQTSIVQETSKVLVAPQSLKTPLGSLDPNKIQNLVTEIGGLRKGVIDRTAKGRKGYLYMKGNTPVATTEEAGSKRGIIHPPEPKGKEKSSKKHGHRGKKAHVLGSSVRSKRRRTHASVHRKKNSFVSA